MRVILTGVLDREDRMLVRDHYRTLRKTGWSRQGAHRKCGDLVIALGAFD